MRRNTKTNTKLNRRSFLKRTAVGGASLAATQATRELGSADSTVAAPIIIQHAVPSTANAPNPIVAENTLPGSPDWPITQMQGDIEGFASATSVAASDALSFYVNTSAKSFDLLIYRTGYYGGVGARLIHEVRGLTGVQQPKPVRDAITGLHTCSHWSPSHQLTVPATWVTGIYMVKLIRPDTGGEAYINFVVRESSRRNEAHKSAVLFQQSVSTYQAYNPHGGKSLYHFNSDSCQTLSEGPRAVKVSFDRPSTLPLYGPNQYFLSDFPFVYWLEAQGYDVSYCTSLDTHRAGTPSNANTSVNTLLGHKVFLSVGHDEYWSQEMHDAIVSARDAGVHIGFFSSNTSYWRVRFEPDPTTGQPDRVMCCYKTTESGAPDPVSPTGTWRDPDTVNQPENALIGMQYVGDNDQRFFPIRISAEYAQHRMYRHTALPQLQPGQYADIGHRLIGWEWDAVVDNGHTPAGLEVLAATAVYGNVLDDYGRTYRIDKAIHHITRYTTASGAQVFAAGTNHWGWGLAIFDPDARLQQITCNLFADMGVLPATPDQALMVDGITLNDTRHVYNDGTQPTFNFLRVAPHTKYGEMLKDDAHALQTSVTVPQVRNVQVQTETTSASVSWETDVPTAGQVWMRIAPHKTDYRLSAEQGWSLPLAAAGVSEPYDTQHKVVAQWLDVSRAYYMVIVSIDAAQQVVILPEVRIETAKGSILNSVIVMLRSWVRSLPCWLRDRGFLASLASGAVLAGVVGAITWRARRLSKRRAKDRHHRKT